MICKGKIGVPSGSHGGRCAACARLAIRGVCWLVDTISITHISANEAGAATYSPCLEDGVVVVDG